MITLENISTGEVFAGDELEFFVDDDTLIGEVFLDGDLIKHGIAPYSVSPNTVIENNFFPEKKIYLEFINHKQYSSIYLILPEIVFFISALTIKLKLLYVIIELTFLFYVYKKKRESFLLISLICLHPLYIIETYASGHFDFLFLFLIVLFYEFYENQKVRNLAYLLSVITKGFSLLFLKM